jgi:hypothetical protein
MMRADAADQHSVINVGVREPSVSEQNAPGSSASPSPVAHPSDRLLIQLNDDWRVVDDDRQYVIQRRRGHARSRATGWIGRCLSDSRSTLALHSQCGDLEPEAIAAIESLPLAKEKRRPGRQNQRAARKGQS